MATLKLEHARYVVTVDASRRIISDGAVVIDGDVITHVGRSDELAEVEAERVIDASGKVVAPGLVNAHIHTSYAHAFRGVFPEDMETRTYFPSVFRLQAMMTEEDEYVASLLAMTELVKSGTTTLLDPGSTKYVEAGIRACAESGARLITGIHVTDQPNSTGIPAYSTDEAYRVAAELIEQHDGAVNGRVSAWPMPFSDDWASDELLIRLKHLADERGTGMTFHHINAPDSIKRALEEYGKRPTLHLEDIGLLGPNVLLAHVIELDDAEIEAMVSSETPVVVCPPAFLKLAQGGIAHSRLPELLERGVPVAFGTDSANNGNFIETQHAMRIGALLYKDMTGSTSVMRAEQVLEMGTIMGAKALGMEERIGSLEVGKKADLVAYDTGLAEWSTLHNPVVSLVYNADGRSVDSVIVDGRIVVEGGRPNFVDERALVDRAQAMGEALLARGQVSTRHRWPVE